MDLKHIFDDFMGVFLIFLGFFCFFLTFVVAYAFISDKQEKAKKANASEDDDIVPTL